LSTWCLYVAELRLTGHRSRRLPRFPGPSLVIYAAIGAPVTSLQLTNRRIRSTR
jgi:hypothetical protein